MKREVWPGGPKVGEVIEAQLAHAVSTGKHGAAGRRHRVDQPASAAAMSTRGALVVSWNLTATPPTDASEA